MEATKKVGGPDPSGPQGHPSACSQQLRGGLRGSQGPWINSGSLYFKQGLSFSSEATTDAACGPASQAHIPEPIHQQLQDPAQVSSRCRYMQNSQDALRLSSTGPFSSPIVAAQQHLVMDDGTLNRPACTRVNGTNDVTQYGPYRPRLQVQVGREGKAPAKVLIGWGKGPCNTDQMAPLGTRKSRWLPYFVSAKDSTAEGQAQAPAQDPAQDQGQRNDPGSVQAPAPAKTSSLLSLTPSTPAQATNPVLDATPKPAAAEPYTYTLDHLTNNIAVTKDLSQDLLLRRCGNQWSILLESSKTAPSCQDKVQLKAELPTAAPTSEVFPDHAQEHKNARRQVPPEQHENPVEKPIVYTSRPGSPKPCPEPPDTPSFKKRNQDVSSSQPDKQPLNVCNNCSCVPQSVYQVNCHKQSTPQLPREAMHIPASSVPTCKLQEAVEDQVLVFDMATGNTRVGLLCHDPMGSRAVLVGLVPSHPSLYVPENILSTRSLVRPNLSPASNHSSFWSTTPMLSSPVPSSLSSGSYREVALVPKEARLNLESRDSPGIETPVRVGIFTGPVPLETPLQFGERIRPHVPDPGWSKPDAEKNEPSHTIWMLESSRMPDTSVIQTKKLQWMNSEPASSVDMQVVPKPLLQEDVGSHPEKEVITAHPDKPQTKDAGQVPLTGQSFLNGQNLLARQLPIAEEGSQLGQPPSSKQLSITGQLPFTGQNPLINQFSLTGQVPFTRKPPTTTKDPTLPKGPLTSGETCQVSTQESEPLDLPTHVEVLRVPLVPEENCSFRNREMVGIGSAQSPSMHQLSSWQPGSSPRGHEEHLSLIAFTTPGTGCKVLPVAMVDTESQSGNQFKLTAEDITHSSVVTHLGLLRGACYELVSTMDALSGRSPVLCRHSSSPYQNMAAVVIDTGTGFTKCGLAGEDHVLSVVPSQVQLLQHPAQGQPRYAVPENQEGSYPVLNRGVVSDWDALEVLWQHLFYCRLGVQPEELAVLVADSPISPRTNREKVAEILFERFHVPAMQTVHQALLALYAYGRTTGLVLGSGHGTSYVAPILTGDLAPLDTYRLDVAGADLTDYLAQLLLAGGRSPLKAGFVNQIKEACCYVAMDMATEMARTQTQAQVDFVLPDKQIITLGSERFCCPEALFQPNLLGVNQPGLPQLALLSISRLEAKQQKQLLANVVLDGGSTLVSGFPERLRQELGPGATVLGSPHRAVAAWLGGSIMACRDSFQSLWLSRREYEEEGPWAIYKYQL
ncbi:uncharacterized protein LOC124992750 [Sciurus carolinensis]|uniref:uncharacterized protein LOC124992750 n=1 Tax=Sciurus carolinensis TaxID=30640 RepID=UPI001FB250A0|nr:uncharacterized protein LOC124992750 [Sciurus carolinensis]